MSAVSTACEAAEVADYHASTAHPSRLANDYFTYRAIEEMEADCEHRASERAADSAQWREFGIYSNEREYFSDD